MKELTLKRSPVNVKIVEGSSSVISVLYKILKELMPKRKSMNIRNVGEPFMDM